MKRFTLGVLVTASPVMAYGVWCILSGQAWVPRKGFGLAPVSGSQVVTAGLSYILLAAYAYVDLDWRHRERLRRFRIPTLIMLGAAFAGLILFG